MRKQAHRSERGQSLVELALTFTLLLILLSGVIDLGRAFFTFMALRDAAQEGATYGSIMPADTAGIVQRVRTSSTMPVNLADAGISVKVTLGGAACNGTSIRVDVNQENFPLVMPFLGAIIGTDTIPIRATVTDEILTPPCK